MIYLLSSSFINQDSSLPVSRRKSWERAQTIATIRVQPHVKKGTKLTPKKLIPLPWDKETHEKPDTPQMTAEERRKRFERLAKAIR